MKAAPDISSIKSVYLLGIGGIGMSALARYFSARGARVSGYDKTPSDITDAMQKEGINVHFAPEQDVTKVKADLYIYTPAIPKSHPTFDVVTSTGAIWYKRSEVLQWISTQSKAIAIAGSHGKTTTTAITAHLLHHGSEKVAGFVGGVMTNYDSNVILDADPQILVVEADEYDRSFLRLAPDLGVITSIDPDHLDIYGSFDNLKKDFQAFAANCRQLLVHESVYESLAEFHPMTYGQSEKADFRISEIHVAEGKFHFDWSHGDHKMKLSSQLPGTHNALNATAAISVAHLLGMKEDQIERALADFRGVRRRFEKVIERADKVLIDDYAHHPKEIDAAVSAARKLYPEKKIGVVFQPHLFTRTRDLEDGFVESLSRADEVILLPIYPAREEPISGVNSEHLLNKLTLKTKRLVEKSDLVNAVLSLSTEIVMMLGAGDIDRLVAPVAKALNDRPYVE